MWYNWPMASDQILEQISALLASEDDSTVNTSMRLPAKLREAAALATEHLGVAPSTTAYTAQLLRSDIEASLLAAFRPTVPGRDLPRSCRNRRQPTCPPARPHYESRRGNRSDPPTSDS